MTQDQINAFQAASGISITDMEIMMRMVAGCCLSIWGCWMCLGSIDNLRSEREVVGQTIQRLFRVSIVLMLGFLLIGYR